MDINFRIEGNNCLFNINGKNFKEEIKKDEHGFEYFNIPNYKIRIGEMFDFRIGDAIETIREDIGDEIITNSRCSLRVMVVKPIVRRYIDREYGNIIRKRTLKEIEGIRYKYAFIRFSLFGLMVVDKNYEFIAYDAETVKDKALLFDTEEEIQKEYDYIWSIRDKLVRDINDLDAKTVDELEEMIKKVENGKYYNLIITEQDGKNYLIPEIAQIII